jgi:1-aminocyclopropane-1-carboxylate deaminase
MFIAQPSPLQQIQSTLFPHLDLWVKRDDLLHADVSGNKFRKLKYSLLPLLNSRTTLITMGGAWSNHLHATAHAARLMNVPAIGLVRGLHHDERHPSFSKKISPTLQDCHQLGMQLYFVSHQAYQQLRDDETAWRNIVPQTTGATLWLPEGGSAPLALRGVAEMIDELPFVPDMLAVACGTGATLAGILAGLHGRSQVLGIAVIKNSNYLHNEVRSLLQSAGYATQENYALLQDYHHGGYAKVTPVLRAFCDQFMQETGIPIEPTYTGKLFYALYDLAQHGYFQANQKIVALHTGGLQASRTLNIDAAA